MSNDVFCNTNTDCANCANLVEEAVKKVAGVKSANVVFMTQKMIIEFDDDADIDAVMKEVVRVAKKVEPDFEIIGPEVGRKLTPNSLATICAKVVFPSPGGPNKST